MNDIQTPTLVTEVEGLPSKFAQNKKKYILIGLGGVLLILLTAWLIRSSALTNQFIPADFGADGTTTAGSVEVASDAGAAGGSFIRFLDVPDPEPTPTPTPTPTEPPSNGGQATKCDNTSGAQTVSSGGNIGSAISGGNKTVVVGAGTYDGFSMSGDNTILCAAPGTRPVIYGSVSISGTNVVIEGFELDGSGLGDDETGIYQNAGSHIFIWNNWIHDFGLSGIESNSSNTSSSHAHYDIRYNRIYNNSTRSTCNGSGISTLEVLGGDEQAELDGYHNHIMYNYIYNNYATKGFSCVPGQVTEEVTDGNGIIFGPDSHKNYQGRSLVKYNLVVDNGGQGIQIFNFPNVSVISNSVYHNLKHVGASTEANGGDIAFNSGDVGLFGQAPANCVAKDNAVEPSAGHRTDVKNECSSMDMSGNVVGNGLFTSANTNPFIGNWTTTGAASGIGAPWPLW